MEEEGKCPICSPPLGAGSISWSGAPRTVGPALAFCREKNRVSQEPLVWYQRLPGQIFKTRFPLFDERLVQRASVKQSRGRGAGLIGRPVVFDALLFIGSLEIDWKLLFLSTVLPLFVPFYELNPDLNLCSALQHELEGWYFEVFCIKPWLLLCILESKDWTVPVSVCQWSCVVIKRPMCVPKLKVSSWRTRLCAFCACFACKSGSF